MTDRTEFIRDLAAQVAPLLPGTWHAEWEEHTVGAYLVTNGEYPAFPVSIYVSAQTGGPEKRGMIRLSPTVPQEYRNVGIDPKNKVTDIYVSEDSPPSRFAREIVRRILTAQEFLARHARQAARIAAYHQAEDADAAVAAELAAILGETADGSRVRAYPHGDWEVSGALTGGSIYFSGYLPASVAFKVARLIMAEYAEHRRNYP